MSRCRRPDSNALTRYFEVTPHLLSRFRWEQIRTILWNGNVSTSISLLPSIPSINRLTKSDDVVVETPFIIFHSGITTTSVLSLPILDGAKDVLLKIILSSPSLFLPPYFESYNALNI